MGERLGIAQKGVRAVETRKPRLEMAQSATKLVFALPGYQQISVNTLVCDSLGLSEKTRHDTETNAKTWCLHKGFSVTTSRTKTADSQSSNVGNET